MKAKAMFFQRKMIMERMKIERTGKCAKGHCTHTMTRKKRLRPTYTLRVSRVLVSDLSDSYCL